MFLHVHTVHGPDFRSGDYSRLRDLTVHVFCRVPFTARVGPFHTLFAKPMSCHAPSHHMRASFSSLFVASAPCKCHIACPELKLETDTIQTLPPALIISSSTQCFEGAGRQVRQAGFNRIEQVPASFVEANETVAMCCKKGKCGHGRRSKPTSRARIDGVTRAHRQAWRHVVASARPHAIFEDDIELLGTAQDVQYAVGICERLHSCGLAYLGIGNEGLLAHAYVVWPQAAARLLTITNDLCNPHGHDYEMRSICRRRPSTTSSRLANHPAVFCATWRLERKPRVQ